MLSVIKPKVEPLISLIASPFLRFDPNVLTLIGLVPPVLFFIFLVSGNKLAALLSLLGVIFDFIDGYVARKTNRVTAFGGLLDSTIDRVADALLIAAFGFAGIVAWELVVLLIILSYLISYIRSRAELAAKSAFKLDVGIIERSERLLGIVIITAASAFDINIRGNLSIAEFLYILLCLLSFITVVQRLLIARKRLENY